MEPAQESTEALLQAQDERWMRHAMVLAARAEGIGEIPVGAVLVLGDEILGEGWNRSISDHDACAHAEIMALRAAGARLGNYRLLDTTLYVTLEPCLMCVGAMIHARVGLLVYGATDPRCGAVDSRLPGPDLPFFNHRFDVLSGVMAGECGEILRDFFRKKRRGGAG